MPWPTRNSPVQSSPSRPSASSRSSIDARRPSPRPQAPARRRIRRGRSRRENLHAAQRSSACRRGGSGRGSSSSITCCGKATTSTSHGAWRSTKSTVGEKKRDCRRQRGEEPSTIRSASMLARAVDDRAPDRARADGRATTSTPSSSPSSARLRERASARASVLGIGASSGRSSGTRINVQRLDRARRARRELDRRGDHLLADDPELHRHQDAAEVRHDDKRLLVRRRSRARSAPRRASGGPRRRRRARARARRGRRSARRGAWRARAIQIAKVRIGADDRGERDLGAAERDVERRAVRPRQVGLDDPQPDHRELRGREREQHAEREDAREERDLVRDEGAAR